MSWWCWFGWHAWHYFGSSVRVWSRGALEYVEIYDHRRCGGCGRMWSVLLHVDVRHVHYWNAMKIGRN